MIGDVKWESWISFWRRVYDKNMWKGGKGCGKTSLTYPHHAATLTPKIQRPLRALPSSSQLLFLFISHSNFFLTFIYLILLLISFTIYIYILTNMYVHSCISVHSSSLIMVLILKCIFSKFVNT